MKRTAGERMFTLRRASGEEVGDGWVHYVTSSIDDWTSAQEEAVYDDGPSEWVIEEWIRVRTVIRTLGGVARDDAIYEPVEE